MILSKEYHYSHDGIPLASAGLNLVLLEEYIESPKVIMEFGSFDGGDGLRYKLSYPNCDVYSIEADSELFGKIKQLEKYGLKVFNYAICNRNMSVEFYRCRFVENYYCYQSGDVGGSGSLLLPTEYNKKVVCHQRYENTTIRTPGITIQQFCEEHNIYDIDLMHIDVEGATTEVLEGFGGIRPKTIFVEVDGAIKFWEGAPEFELINFVFDKMEYKLIARDSVNCFYVKKEII